MKFSCLISALFITASISAQEFSSLINPNDRLKLNPAQALINSKNYGFSDFQKIRRPCNQVADYLISASVDNLNSNNIIDKQNLQTRGNLRLGSFRFAGGINYERTGSRQFNYHQVGFSLAYGFKVSSRMNIAIGGETGFSWHKFRTEMPSMFEFFVPTSSTSISSVSPINLSYGFQLNRVPEKIFLDRTYFGFNYRTDGIPNHLPGARTHQFTTYGGMTIGKRLRSPYMNTRGVAYSFRFIYRENLVRGQSQNDFNGNPFGAYRHLTLNIGLMTKSNLGFTVSYQDYLNGFRSAGTEFVYLFRKMRMTAGSNYNFNHKFAGVNISAKLILDHCRRGHRMPHRSYHLSF